MGSEFDSRDVGTELDEEEEHANSRYLGQMDIIPEVRRYDFLHFKNRFGDAEDGLYAVEILECDSFLAREEIEGERRLRQNLPRNRVKSKGGAASSSLLPPKAKPTKSASTPSQANQAGKLDRKFISRIRIQSPAILSILSKIMQESWGKRPRTYIRPFSPLIYFYPQVLRFLKELEIKWGSNDAGLAASQLPTSVDGASERKDDEDSMSVDDSPAALADLTCYVQFMSSEIMPLYTQYEDLDET